MSSDMLVALGPATVGGVTLFGVNCHGPADAPGRLVFEPGRAHVTGEKVAGHPLELPECRQTWTVLAHRPNSGWGYQHGVNEHQVAAGCADWHTIVRGAPAGLSGTDLVRLALERATSARQAVDVVIDLLRYHGQGRDADDAGREDSILLVADPREAYVLEMAGRFWALQAINQLRAVGDVGIIRQDWNRLAPGLSEFAIDGGHHPHDGSKVDFVGAVSAAPAGTDSALRRWGRATVLLEAQNGHIDADCFRRVLADHYEGTRFEVDPFAPEVGAPTPLCRHAGGGEHRQTRLSMITGLAGTAAGTGLVWLAFGQPCVSVYFPFLIATHDEMAASADFVDEQAKRLWRLFEILQRPIQRDPEVRALAQERLGWLQSRVDQDTEEFMQELTALRNGGGLSRHMQALQERHAELVSDLVGELVPQSAGGDVLVRR